MLASARPRSSSSSSCAPAFSFSLASSIVGATPAVWTLVCGLLVATVSLSSRPISAQSQPNFLIARTQSNFLIAGHNMENLRIPESQPVGSVVHQLRAVDRTNENRLFSYHMTGDAFLVDEQTGEVRLVKPLDRERQSQMMVVVSVFDQSDTKNDLPLESKRRIVIVEDADDSWPVFGPHKHLKSASPASARAPASYLYQVELSELAPVNSTVIDELQASDADEGSNADIVFECRARASTNSACDVFGLERRRLGPGRYALGVRTRAPLDYETVKSYRMVVIARGRKPAPSKELPWETEAIINIDLTNAQDEGPVFANAPYAISVLEGLKSGTRLLSLVVQDGDAAPQRDLSVFVAPGPFREYFQLTQDPDSSRVWYLETNATLDREHPQLLAMPGNLFNISLLAVELNESGKPVASEDELMSALREPAYARGSLRKENVTVVVLDVADSRPLFVHATTGQPIMDNVLALSVAESVATGSPLPNLDLAVLDLDQGVNSRFNLSLMDSDQGPAASQALALATETVYGRTEVVLRVLNSSLLDYENPAYRAYKFSLIASKSAELVRILEIQLNLVDVNDNAPEFERNQYFVDVAEGTPPGSLVTTIRARDRDSGPLGKLDYMLRGPGAAKFKLVASEGKILVNECGQAAQCLDHETQSNYSLTYEARDGGGRTKNVSVIINVLDVNDNAPRFTEQLYRRELISDNLSSKQNYISPQLIVKARDDDGMFNGRNNVTYRITSSNLTGLDVEPVSGLVYLSQPIDLDSLMLETASAAGDLAARPPGLAGPGDRKLLFEAEVMALDNGVPPLNSSAKIQLVVRGNPEGAPQFSHELYQAFVREDQPIGKPFFQVQAIDPDEKDSQLRYSLGFDLNDLVNINSLTGELSFKTRADYDDFKGQLYNVTVFATDNSRPYPLKASSVVSILVQDVNDKAPKFMEREPSATLVQGRSKPGETVLQVVALDDDTSAQLNYSLLCDQLLVQDRNGQQFYLDQIVNATTGYLAQMNKLERHRMAAELRDLFHINNTNGVIELNSEPDYSFAASISVPVRVSDLKQEVSRQPGELQQDTTMVTFFLQKKVDKSPVFASPMAVSDRYDNNITLLEELNVGTPIFSLLAHDPRTGSRIEEFEKVHESDRRNFFRVERNGIVYINKPINYEELPAPKRLSLAVKALADEDHFSIANINFQVIDINDNAPVFKSPNYTVTISEAATHPQEVLSVQAEDKDSAEFSQVFYSISGYSSELFAIDPKRGTITIKRGVKLDRDTEPEHSFLVTASDCNDTSRADAANRLHHDLSGRGAIMGAMGSPMNGAHSNCKRSSALVRVILSDENDNDPVFTNVNKRGELELQISETITVGSVIARVSATDADEGPNGQVHYEIVRGDDEAAKLMKIDHDGHILVTGPLAGLGRGQPYRVTIRAFDHGKQSRQAFATLVLHVNDVVSNDGVPRFTQPRADEVIYLSENVEPRTFVYQVQAVDPDEEGNGKLMYEFVQPSDVFEIDPFTGVIKTQYRPNFQLDREQVANYTLIVAVHDLSSPPKQAHQVLNIRITDVNDNEPYFERGVEDPPVELFVDEEVPKDTLIGSIHAIDKDVGQNALIGYEIIDGNQNNMFRLSFDLESPSNATAPDSGLSFRSNNLCRIYSNGRLDRETRDTYSLTIKAMSASKLRNTFNLQLRDPLNGRNPFYAYNASDLTKIQLTIKLLDINDNRPQFTQQNAKTVVDSSADPYSQLMVLKATDADSSDLDIQYSILDVLHYSDSKFLFNNDDSLASSNSFAYRAGPASSQGTSVQPVSMRHVFDIDPVRGTLRNAVSLRPYIDGFFEVFVKADSGDLRTQQADSLLGGPGELMSSASSHGAQQHNEALANKCQTTDSKQGRKPNSTTTTISPSQYAHLENCNVAVTKATVFITHQRETFRFVFNKTRLNDRFDEFKSKIQGALEEIIFDSHQVQASLDPSSASSLTASAMGPTSLGSFQPTDGSKPEKIYLNTFDTDFYEREDGSMDFSILTSCSQLVKFGPTKTNQVVNYDQVLSLLRMVNSSQVKQHKVSLFNQYGLLNIEKCLPDKAMHRMSLPERTTLWLAAAIGLVCALLALIVHKRRKAYERNLRLLQRSKYQFMNPYMSPAAHMSFSSLQNVGTSNFVSPPYGGHHLDYDSGGGAGYDTTWQL